MFMLLIVNLIISIFMYNTASIDIWKSLTEMFPAYRHNSMG